MYSDVFKSGLDGNKINNIVLTENDVSDLNYYNKFFCKNNVFNRCLLKENQGSSYEWDVKEYYNTKYNYF